jgi:hypothetical protein
MANLTLAQLEFLQGIAALIFLVCLGLGALYLIAGLIRPAWVRRSKRRWVVVTTLVVWVLGLATYLGAIAFTHSHPNGPHAFKGYWESYVDQMCAQGQDIPACREGAGVSGAGGTTPAPPPAP